MEVLHWMENGSCVKRVSQIYLHKKQKQLNFLSRERWMNVERVRDLYDFSWYRLSNLIIFLNNMLRIVHQYREKLRSIFLHCFLHRTRNILLPESLIVSFLLEQLWHSILLKQVFSVPLALSVSFISLVLLLSLLLLMQDKRIEELDEKEKAPWSVTM